MSEYRRQQKAADRLTAAVLVRVGAANASEVQCPREQSAMTPCVARDGHTAVADDGACVGCGILPSDELARIEAP
jgi:hypothetical protein